MYVAKLRKTIFSINKTLIIAIFLATVLAIWSPYILTVPNLLNVLRQISVAAIAGFGFTLALGSRNIDLSVGSMLGLVGGIMAKLMVDAGLPVYAVIFIGLISGVLLGMFNAFLINTFSIPPFIVTLANALLFRGILFLVTNNVSVIGLPENFVFIGQGYLWNIPVQVYVVAFVCIMMYILANRTKFGRYVVAMGANEEASRIAGINTKRVRYGVYAVVGLCTAVAAILQTGRTASAQISAGLYMEMDVIAAVVIGGTVLYGGNVNIIGTLFGVLIMGIIANGLNLLGINPNYQIIAKGLLILFALIMDRFSVKSRIIKSDF